MALFNFDCSLGVQWNTAIPLTIITRKLGKTDEDSFCLNFKFVFFRLKMKSSVVFKFNVMLFLISHLPKGWVSRIVLYWFKCYGEFPLMHTKFSKKLINPPVTAGHEQGDCRPLHELLDNSCFSLTIRKTYQYFQLFFSRKILLLITVGYQTNVTISSVTFTVSNLTQAPRIIDH